MIGLEELFADGYVTVNQRLAEAEREDLAIDKPAPMKQLFLPAEILNRQDGGGNFQAGFGIYTGHDTDTTPISVTADELTELRKIPKFSDLEEISQYQDEHVSPLLPNLLRYNHVTRPAFIRMYLLYPEFTQRLVLGLSQNRDPYRYKTFEAESFAAYTVMSNLVDASDLAVVINGEIDERYLTR